MTEEINDADLENSENLRVIYRRPPPKTSAERQRKFRAGKKALGYKMVQNLWVKPEDEAKVKMFAESLNNKT